FDLARIHVDYGDALVAVTVRDVGLISFVVDDDLGDLAEVLRVVTSLALSFMSELREELSGLGELQDVGVGSAVAADPDVAFAVDSNTVIGIRPFPACRGLLVGTAPTLDDVTV